MSSGWSDGLRRTIGLRLAAWYLGTFLASTLLMGTLTYGLLATSLESRDRQLIEQTLLEYAARYRAGGFAALASAVELERRSGLREPLFVRVVGPFQDVLLYSLPESWGAFDLSELGGNSTEVWRRVQARDRAATLEIATLRVGGGTVLQVGKSTESREALLARFRQVLLLGAAAAVAIGLAGGLLLTRSTLKPLRDLRDTVQRIVSTGQTDDRVPLAGTGDAVDELGALVNSMLARITTLITGMRNALDHVAHDLRTPMMRLRATAESALASGDPARQREALSDCLEESDRVLSMLDTLMDISEAEAGTMKLTIGDVDTAAAVREVVELYEDAAEAKRLTLEISVPDGLVLRADRDRLRQALANVADNAIKYTPEGGRVAISAARDGAFITLRVTDTGPGIPPQDLPRIWDRLYRGDQSRSTRGLGLGLSLVKASVEAQGGTVGVREPGTGNQEPGTGNREPGTEFFLTLPAAPPSTSPVR